MKVLSTINPKKPPRTPIEIPGFSKPEISYHLFQIFNDYVSTSLSVKEKNKGLGTRFLKAVEKKARAEGIDRIIIAHVVDRAEKFYRRAGYVKMSEGVNMVKELKNK